MAPRAHRRQNWKQHNIPRLWLKYCEDLETYLIHKRGRKGILKLTECGSFEIKSVVNSPLAIPSLDIFSVSAFAL